MTDAEAELLLPGVEELVSAVADRSLARIKACFSLIPAETHAIVLAELLLSARGELAGLRDREFDASYARRVLGEAYHVNRVLRERLNRSEARVGELSDIIFSRKKVA